MGNPLKIILVAIATMLVAIGLAAQTGTVHIPGEGHSGTLGSGAVEAQQASASPTPPTPEASPTPAPTQAPAPPPQAGPPPGKQKKHGG